MKAKMAATTAIEMEMGSMAVLKVRAESGTRRRWQSPDAMLALISNSLARGGVTWVRSTRPQPAPAILQGVGARRRSHSSRGV